MMRECLLCGRQYEDEESGAPTPHKYCQASCEDLAESQAALVDSGEWFEPDFGQIVSNQLARQGVAAISVSDGQIMVFSMAVLEQLLERAKAGNGTVSVFFKTEEKEQLELPLEQRN
jgi:hypothetical protein